MYLGAGIVIILVIAVILFLRSRAGGPASAGAMPQKGKRSTHDRRLDYQPAARPVTPMIRMPVPRPAGSRQQESRAIPPSPEAIPVVQGRTDIADSTRALAEKYSLTGFTLATTDGLVFSTSGISTATEDAAQYGGNAPSEGAQADAGVRLFTLSHQGTILTGIIRAEKSLTHDTVRRIESDTQEILNRWI